MFQKDQNYIDQRLQKAMVKVLKNSLTIDDLFADILIFILK
jgi:hypothetical protein